MKIASLKTLEMIGLSTLQRIPLGSRMILSSVSSSTISKI
jgi:hypothetical protein